jgi:phenylalanyl-tRNA synthetase beta chain
VFEGYDEKERLAIAITPGNFTKLKQVVEYFGRMLDIKFDIANSKEFPNYFIEGRVAEIKFNNKSIGFIGEIHPKILTNFRIKMPVSLLEINIDDILENHPK